MRCVYADLCITSVCVCVFSMGQNTNIEASADHMTAVGQLLAASAGHVTPTSQSRAVSASSHASTSTAAASSGSGKVPKWFKTGK